MSALGDAGKIGFPNGHQSPPLCPDIVLGFASAFAASILRLSFVLHPGRTA